MIKIFVFSVLLIACCKEHIQINDKTALTVSIAGVVHNFNNGEVSLSVSPCPQGSLYSIVAVRGEEFLISVVSTRLTVGQYTAYYTYWGATQSSGQILLTITSAIHAQFTGALTGEINFRLVN